MDLEYMLSSDSFWALVGLIIFFIVIFYFRVPGMVLRALDKLNATTSDMRLSAGEGAVVGRLEVVLEECRYPTDDPASNAYAFLVIREPGVAAPAFRGWMVAASPALNPLDHPRYDVWVLRCTTS